MGQGAEDMDSRWAWGGSRQAVDPPAQAGGDAMAMLIEIDGLIADWRAGRYKGDYVLSRLSQMFPSTPSAASRT